METSQSLIEKPSLAVVATDKGHTVPMEPDLEAARDATIRRTAYALYEARGCADGQDLDDWLKAEAEWTRSSTVHKPRGKKTST